MGYICTKATELLLQARRENKSPDIEQLIRTHTDALGLLGHISFEISQRRRDAIRPNLNKEYATLCASHVPITKMLFGDEQQNYGLSAPRFERPWFTYKNDLLNSFNHMFNHMALELSCGALRPGALQLGGAQTGYRATNTAQSYSSFE